MIPIHIEIVIFPPGTKLWSPEEVKTFQHQENTIKSGLLLCTSNLGWFEDALAFYLPDSGETLEKSSREEIDELGSILELKIVEGVTTETIFMVAGAHDTADFNQGYRTQESWAVEFMAEGNHDEIKEQVQRLYEDALKLSTETWEKEKQPSTKIDILDLTNPEKRGYDPEIKKPYPIKFLTLWSVETSIDWETSITEVERFHYEGPAETRLMEIKEEEVNPETCPKEVVDEENDEEPESKTKISIQEAKTLSNYDSQGIIHAEVKSFRRSRQNRAILKREGLPKGLKWLIPIPSDKKLLRKFWMMNNGLSAGWIVSHADNIAEQQNKLKAILKRTSGKTQTINAETSMICQLRQGLELINHSENDQ